MLYVKGQSGAIREAAAGDVNGKGKRLSDLTYLTRPIHKLILLIEA